MYKLYPINIITLKTFDFILERYKLSNEYKSISTLAFLTTFLAVIEYYNMREFFSLSNLDNPYEIGAEPKQGDPD